MSTVETQWPAVMTVDEFMAWDGSGHVGKLELVDGVVRAQSYASDAHGTIQANLAFLLNNYFHGAGNPCRVGTEPGVVPIFDSSRNVRKPDLAVTCVEPKRGQREFPDPVLIVEILSPSNQDDTWESIRACATIPSVKEILVVDSEKWHAEVFTKDEKGNWPQPGVVTEGEGRLRLFSFELDMDMADVYRGTDLKDEA